MNQRDKERSVFHRRWRKLLRRKDYEEVKFHNMWLVKRGPLSQHGCYLQIPKRDTGKPVYSVVRDPVKRFVSIYGHKFWARHPKVPNEIIQSKYPEFPELSMERYLDFQIDSLIHGMVTQHDKKLDLGHQTVQFICMFFKEPLRVLKTLNQKYMESDAFLKDIAPIKFLRQENLREDLGAMLAQYDYTPAERQMLFLAPNLNVTEKMPDFSSTKISEDLTQKVKYRERFLYHMLNTLSFTYPA